MWIAEITGATIRVAAQAFTGNLLSSALIEDITNEAVRRLFPRSGDELEASKRVDAARGHIAQATNIILSLKDDLERQSQQLDALATDIAEKQTQANHYAALLRADKETFDAYKSEIERTVREELIKQSEQGRRLRQIGSAIFWIINLFIGAAVGVYFPQILEWAKGIFSLVPIAP